MDSNADEKNVWVAFFSDGLISGIEDPLTGEIGFKDWSFDVIKVAGMLLSHGGQFVYTADDAFNPCTDPDHPDVVFPLPGPGMFAAMMLKLMYPHGRDSAFCCGKGGNVGTRYMMQRAISKLRQQGYSGSLDEILMVGDRFDTDIRGGLSAGIKSCLVLSGCHKLEYQCFYRADPTLLYADSVGMLTKSDAARSDDARSDDARSDEDEMVLVPTVLGRSLLLDQLERRKEDEKGQESTRTDSKCAATLSGSQRDSDPHLMI